MSQKSSLPQVIQFVPAALTLDRLRYRDKGLVQMVTEVGILSAKTRKAAA